MHYNDIPGLVDHTTRESVIDYAASKAQDDMIFIELGSYLGSTVCRLASQIKERNINCKIYAIDNWVCGNISRESIEWSNLVNHSQVYPTFLHNVHECGLDGRVTPIVSDTTEAAKMFEDKSIDYIFFDANHGYDGLKLELEAWMPKLKDNALAAVHDWPDHAIQKAVRDLELWYEPTGEGNSAWLRKTL